MAIDITPIAQGPAKIADADALAKDADGFTSLNLHRRIDPQLHSESGEVRDRDYALLVQGTNSYRYTEVYVHDEESTTCEIP